MNDQPSAQRIIFAGRVQGVGFRPHLARLAAELGLAGWVRNQTGTVEALIEGPEAARQAFVSRAVAEAPPLAAPVMRDVQSTASAGFAGFSIRASNTQTPSEVFVPPDTAPCPECLRELTDPEDRRFRYPFTNCTQCGPRYTVINSMPYDRLSTTMTEFALCLECRSEYRNAEDRRFHAEPVACPVCGPHIWFSDSKGRVSSRKDEALSEALAALRSGGILALRGVGGYQLLCDAGNEPTVATLRRRKGRPDKPLAIMVPQSGANGIDHVRSLARVDPEAEAALLGPARPIVLLHRKETERIAPSVAPGCPELGIFLPGSPLHHLLLDGFGGPLVVTSGNLSGEPMLTDPDNAERRLGGVADGFLHHNRPIARPADDPVLRPLGGHLVPLRLGRGNAPAELPLGFPLAQPALATGAQAKVTVALGFGQRTVVSPHLGDMETPRSLEVFTDVAESLQRLYGKTAEAIACDAHPGIATTRWAHQTGLPVVPVLHHHAHASALVGEQPPRDGDWLVFTWDALGYGSDGGFWGGETFAGAPGRWHRVASFRPLRLVGGDRAAREPWRSAAALCWDLGEDLPAPPEGVEIAHHAWKRRLATHETSAAGRLFDAAACLVSGIQSVSFEAQAPMTLEALSANQTGNSVGVPLRCSEDGLLVADWRPLVPGLIDRTIPAAQRAADFHVSLAALIGAIVGHLTGRIDFNHVGLTGGVFQNARLVSEAQRVLRSLGHDPIVHRHLPCNDASISFGQLVELAARPNGGT